MFGIQLSWNVSEAGVKLTGALATVGTGAAADAAVGGGAGAAAGAGGLAGLHATASAQTSPKPRPASRPGRRWRMGPPGWRESGDGSVRAVTPAATRLGTTNLGPSSCARPP